MGNRKFDFALTKGQMQKGELKTKENLFFSCLFFLTIFLLCNKIDGALTPLNNVEYSGTIKGGSIAYQTNFFQLSNILNPLTISIIVNTTNPVNICLNSNQGTYAVSGANLPNSCPIGSFISITNMTSNSFTSSMKLQRKISSNSQKMQNFADKMMKELNNNIHNNGFEEEDEVPDSTSLIYVSPSTAAGFTVSIPASNGDDTSIYSFKVIASGYYCEDETTYPVGVNNECISIQTIQLGVTSINNLAAAEWAYFRVDLGNYLSSSLNALVVSMTGATNGAQLFIQQNYIPSQSWAIDGDQSISGDVATQYVYTPAYLSAGQSYFIGVYNSGSANLSSTLNLTTSTCDHAFVGPNCSMNPDNSTTNEGNGLFPLSATVDVLNNNETSESTNTGQDWTFDFSDSSFDGEYAYFLITNLPERYVEGNNPAYLRVSIANVEIGDDDDNLPIAPSLYAKLDGYPSKQSYDYQISKSQVANQLSLPYLTVYANWIIAVELPANFALWVGVNCANNCSNEERGVCYCSYNGEVQNCNVATGDGDNLLPLYRLPTNVGDSEGVCQCTDSAYDLSYDCSEKIDSSAVLILIITLVGAVLIGAAIAIPAYFVIRQRKRSQYEKL